MYSLPSKEQPKIYHMGSLWGIFFLNFVLPLYDYCDVVWSPTISKFTSMLERVQYKFTRKLPPSCASKLSFTLTEHQCYHTAIQVFRSVATQLFSSIFVKCFSLLQRCNRLLWRKTNNLFVPRDFTNFGIRKVPFIAEWNSLPSVVVEAAKLPTFKYLYFNS